ncbi:MULTISPECIES: hypothetical protein [unclassified Haladaptatus]|uniref:DUF7519 family protein n=1 Tax=unclassified Haladaptatus TaxID=2622732 RepID=UPI00209BD09F|nr:MULTISPECIES: hypothetical protein [unclassified Haladaptatus]MCO8247041.1 hypothetical protein [Haladaptatus sp. AB643]MCO8254575.1 hypothetical protein [Haladaptatus sp. AB618]
MSGSASETIDRSPARVSQLLSVIAASVALGAGALFGGIGALFGLFGLLFVAIGVVRGSRRLVTTGGFVLLAGILAGSLVAAPPELLIPGAIATVLAWDFGEQAINVGEQLGREADTQTLEIMHAASSTIVGVAAGALGYGVYLAGGGGKPVTALVFLLIAMLALTSALRA